MPELTADAIEAPQPKKETDEVETGVAKLTSPVVIRASVGNDAGDEVSIAVTLPKHAQYDSYTMHEVLMQSLMNIHAALTVSDSE